MRPRVYLLTLAGQFTLAVLAFEPAIAYAMAAVASLAAYAVVAGRDVFVGS